MLAIAGVLAMGLTLAGCTQPVALFNGEDLNGWTTFLADETVDPAKVWSVSDGVLRCEGQPNGYIRTVGTYSDYTLRLEWRWPETPSNSGVLLHTVGENKIWPQCIEAQLKHLSAGDLVTIQPGSTVTVNDVVYQPEGSIFRIIPKRLPTSEKLAGNWNRYTIVCKGDTINLYVNGVHQHSAVNVSPAAGAICLQSEGSPIEFRNIVLTPLNP
jgi:hypothetical protein